MARRIVLGVALAATIVIAACSATTTPPAAPPALAPSAAAPSDAPPTEAPAATPASVAPPSLAPSAAPLSQAPAAVNRPQIVHVLEQPLDWAEVKVGSLSGCKDTTCLGDYIVGHSTMLDAVTHKDVGTLVTECFVVDAGSGRYHCPATTIVLTGRGQIVFTEDPYLGPKFCPTCFAPEASPSVPDYPVIGGTGEFLGATGAVTGPADSTWQYGDFVITLTN